MFGKNAWLWNIFTENQSAFAPIATTCVLAWIWYSFEMHQWVSIRYVLMQREITVISLNIGTDSRPEQTVKTQIRCRRMRYLIRVYTVCHSSSNILNTSAGSWTDLFQILGEYGQELLRWPPILRVNTVTEYYHVGYITLFGAMSHE